MTEEEEIISKAMAILGRKGGKSRTKLKAEVARINGARRHMSDKCSVCGKEAHSWHVSAAKRTTVCLNCMTTYRKTLSRAEKSKDIVLYRDDKGHILVDDRSSETKEVSSPAPSQS
jgi:hypothetical protein